ncbi:MAG: hypothetical protein AABY07_00095 [Nanoarchaeota archaeon]
MGYSIKATETEVKEVITTLAEKNCTYNLSPMFYKALGGEGLNKINNKKAGACEEYIQKGIDAMIKDPKEYRALNPKNGWGTYEDALYTLRFILKACQKFPESIFTIS